MLDYNDKDLFHDKSVIFIDLLSSSNDPRPMVVKLKIVRYIKKSILSVEYYWNNLLGK